MYLLLLPILSLGQALQGLPGGISLVRTTSSTISLISDPVVNVPGALPAGGMRLYL